MISRENKDNNTMLSGFTVHSMLHLFIRWCQGEGMPSG